MVGSYLSELVIRFKTAPDSIIDADIEA